MHNTWKVFIVAVLVIAVAAILAGKRNGANTASPPPKENALPQMIEFGSKTCVPCQMMQPILEELRKEYQGQLEVPFWDVYEHPDKAKSYDIRVIPTQVFIGADGKEFFRHEGFFPKEEILAKFKEHGVILRPAK